MKWLFCILSFTLLISNNVQEELIGEYEGGMPYTIWATLKLKENGKYEYHVSTHQQVYTKDKGKREIKNNQLILNSSQRMKKKIKAKK